MQRVPTYPLVSTHARPPPADCAFATAEGPALAHGWLSPRVRSLQPVPSWGVRSLRFDKCVMTRTHHCSIIQNSFPALRSSVPCLFFPSNAFKCRIFLKFLMENLKYTQKQKQVEYCDELAVYPGGHQPLTLF